MTTVTNVVIHRRSEYLWCRWPASHLRPGSVSSDLGAFARAPRSTLGHPCKQDAHVRVPPDSPASSAARSHGQTRAQVIPRPCEVGSNKQEEEEIHNGRGFFDFSRRPGCPRAPSALLSRSAARSALLHALDWHSQGRRLIPVTVSARPWTCVV